MNHSFYQIIWLGLKGRKQSIRRMALLAFLCIFFFAAIVIFQDCMGRFEQEKAAKEKGDWIFSSEKRLYCIEEYAWIDAWSKLTTRGYGYLDENMYYRGGTLAAIDDTFLDMVNLKLKDGEYPTNASEIMITEQSLERQKKDYTVGQEIDVYYWDGRASDSVKHDMRKLTFVISGIIENDVSNLFYTGDNPEYFMTEAGLDRFQTTLQDYHRYFYHLSEKHRNIDVKALYSQMRELVKEQEGTQVAYNMQFNSNVYDLTMWDNQGMYYLMMTACLLLGFISLVYVFFQYRNNRRGSLARLRNLGATDGQLRQIICLEWCTIYGISACAAIGLSVLISWWITKAISLYYNISSIFWISKLSICIILGVTIGVCFVMAIWCLLGDLTLHLTEVIPKKRLKKLSRKRDSIDKPIEVFLRRQRRKEPYLSWLMTLYSLIMVSLMAYGWYRIGISYQQYLERVNRTDIVASKKFQEESINYQALNGDEIPYLPAYDFVTDITIEKSWAQSVDRIGIDILNTLQEISGVKKVYGLAEERNMELYWTGQEQSHFRQGWYINQFLTDSVYAMKQAVEHGLRRRSEYDASYDIIDQDNSIYPYLIYGLPQKTKQYVDKRLQEAFGEKYQKIQFWKGEQSVLFTLAGPIDNENNINTLQGFVSYNAGNSDYSFQCQWNVSYQYDMIENSLSDGDIVKIQKNNEDLAETSVLISADETLCADLLGSIRGVVDQSQDMIWQQMIRQGRTSSYLLIGSQSLLEMAESNGNTQLAYRDIAMDLEAGADAKTESMIQQVLAEAGCYYQNFVAEKRSIPKDCYQQWLMFGIFILVLAIAYILIWQSIYQKNLIQVQEQLQQFLRSGMTYQQIGFAYVRKRIGESFILVATIPLGFMIALLQNFIPLYWSKNALDRTQNWKEWSHVAVKSAKEYFGQWLLWLGIGGFIVLSVLICIYGVWRKLRQIAKSSCRSRE